jgi:pimeloyl-ACP methyl ester carboxylesterase
MHEFRYDPAEYREYRSSLDPELLLYARFRPAAEAAPLLVHMHGWHGNVKTGHSDNLAPPPGTKCFRIQPEMRGRGDSGGKPDANGFELHDVVDAMDAACAIWPEAVSFESGPHLHGGSGGGGNVLALVGKFPDLFSSAVAECGISDYARWYAGDAAGEFRDEMCDAGWIGGCPEENPEGYLSRGGLTTAGNLLTPLLLVHGDQDLRVPVEQSVSYFAAAKTAGHEALVDLVVLPGVGLPGHLGGITENLEELRQGKIAAHREANALPPKLPQQGTMVVAGFLITRHFRVFLEDVGMVALLDYDLEKSRFSLRAPSCKCARVFVQKEMREFSVDCEPVSLREFCGEINYGGFLPPHQSLL